MICRNRTGFKNSHLSVFMPIRRKNIIHFSTHFLVIVCFVFERREFFHPERRNIERFHQFKCLFIKAVRFFISTEKYIQNCFAIFMGNCEISSVIWIANDLSVPVIPISVLHQLQYFTNWIEKSFSFIPISKYFSVKCLKSE